MDAGPIITDLSAYTRKPVEPGLFDSIPSRLNAQDRRSVLTSVGLNVPLLWCANSFEWLTCAGLSLHFFDAEKYGEPDFVIQNGLHVELVEVS